MKMPDPVADLDFYFDEHGVTLTFTPKHYGMLPIGKHNLFTEAQMREALAQQEAVMRMALEALKVFRQGYRNPYTAPAIAALEEQLK